jgi:hypothetical protein
LAQVLSLLRQAGFEKVGALFGEGNRQLIVHVADADADSQQKIVDALKPLGELQVVSFASISPRVREETVRRAVTAVIARADCHPALYRHPLLYRGRLERVQVRDCGDDRAGARCADYGRRRGDSGLPARLGD